MSTGLLLFSAWVVELYLVSGRHLLRRLWRCVVGRLLPLPRRNILLNDWSNYFADVQFLCGGHLFATCGGVVDIYLRCLSSRYEVLHTQVDSLRRVSPRYLFQCFHWIHRLYFLPRWYLLP